MKYRGPVALDKAKKRKYSGSGLKIDLSGVPPQLPILKSDNRIKEGASKYSGVCFDKVKNKWRARIRIAFKNCHIGCYENEDEAAINYARAVFKYRGEDALNKARG